VKIRLQYKVTLFIVLSFLTYLSNGQSLPVGTPVLEDYYRRAQLLGKVDSSVSFTSRPFFPAEVIKLNNIFDPEDTLKGDRKNSFDGIYRFWGKRGKIQLLPITWQQQFNTDHPYSINDGAMIPAKGYQTMLSGGLYIKAGLLSVQFRPEVILAQNKPFETFTSTERSDQELIAYYDYKNIIDLPEYFPDEPYKRIFWGQSSIRLTAGPVSAGISSENLWWGPGMRNSLLMTNSAAGFYHFTINTVKPINTPIGSFEGQIIGGRLDPSGFFGADTSLVINNIKLYRTKRDDWRYLNGLVFSYNPHWVPGLFLGFTRSIVVYHGDMGNSFADYFPVFSGLFKKSNYGEGESKTPGDELASVFIRWLLQKDHAELYFEYGREDHSYNLRDFLIQADYSRAYVLGFRKLFPLNKISDSFIQVNFELTQLETNMTNIERSASYTWYAHIAGIWHGYTNMGQLVGAGIGPGSSMQSATVSWGHGLKSLGLLFERYVHNNDLFYIAVKDIRTHWADINLTAFGEWDYKNFLFSAGFGVIRSLNYQYNYKPVTVGLDQYWIPGKDTYAVQGNLGISYRF
jgi:hypothetical protein